LNGLHGPLPKVSVPSTTTSPSLTIDRRRAEFADAGCEQRFLRHVLPERNAQLKTSLLLSAAFYLAFGLTDLATLGATSTAWALVALRVLVALVAIGACAALARRPACVAVSIRATCAVLVTGLAAFPVLCWFQPQAMTWNLMSLALMLMAVYVIFPNRFIYAVGIALGASLAFAAMVLIQGALLPEDVVSLVLLLMLGNTLGYIAARRFHLAQREQFRSSLLIGQLAERDPLTGCYNRRILQQGMLVRELARASGDGLALSVILCDLDHFKRINDTHGHAAGDQLLRQFADLLTMLAGRAGTVIRYGGEEFLIVLPETDAAAADALAERMRAALAAGVMPVGDGAAVSATASFGVASLGPRYAGPPLTVDALIGAADEQLYGVKRSGRNGVQSTLLGDAQALRACA
jgi:diguanylate cyclase (GGDEF)-like protein